MHRPLLFISTVVAWALAASSVDAAPPAPGSLYVSLGSSYAAGTSLPRQANDSPARCGQGTENYPRRVARTLSLRLVDRSCGGATTAHIVDGGQFGLPAQVAAVDREAKLVTITVGGNDVRFVADLGRYSCEARHDEIAQSARPFACSPPPPGFETNAAFARLEAELRRLTAEIRARAPDARIMFVDYTTILPPAGTCPALGLSVVQADIMRQRASRLAAVTARVATATGADLIEASRLTQAHHVCAADPWAWGFVSEAERSRSNAAGFHPRPEAAQAVAQAIIERLQQ